MKILLLNYEYPPLGGGAGNSTMNVAKAFAKLGHDVLVITTWYPGLEEVEHVGKMKIIRVRSRRKRKDRSNPIEMLDYVRKTLAIEFEIKSFDPDYCVAFMSLPSGLAAYRFYKKLKIPYLLSVQGGDVPGFLPDILSLRILQKASFFLTKKVWKNAISVVANSRGLMELARVTGDKIGARTDFFPNGVDTDFFKPKEVKKQDGRIRVLFVGRFYKQKGLDYLVLAIANLREKYSSDFLQIELVGDGPERDGIMQMIQRNKLESYFKISEWCDKNELLKKYQDSDVFVLSSVEEGMPNVISEAMACGLPIVSTRVRGSEELVIDDVNGILVESRDVVSLSQGLDRLIGDQVFREKMAQGSLGLINRYSWEKVCDYYLDLYTEYNK